MDINEYKLMSGAQDRHWWWLGRKKIIETIIEGNIDLGKKMSIADVGCGFGANIPMLRQYGDVASLDMYKEAVETIRQKWGEGVAAHQWVFPGKIDEKFDLVVMADVLEHIKDDAGMIAWVYDHLKLGGVVLLTVPAHQFLWTQMDEVAHHFRRYNKKQLTNLFKDKFEIKKFSFYNLFLFPVKVFFAIIVKSMRKLGINNPNRSYNDIALKKSLAFINFLFKYILYFESELISRFSLPWGVSIIILAKKK